MTLLWVIPITAEECALARQDGCIESALGLLARKGKPYVLARLGGSRVIQNAIGWLPFHQGMERKPLITHSSAQRVARKPLPRFILFLGTIRPALHSGPVSPTSFTLLARLRNPFPARPSSHRRVRHGPREKPRTCLSC